MPNNSVGGTSTKARYAYVVAIFVLFGWHAYQASYFASNVSTGIMPDEGEHFNTIRVFLKYGDWFFVKDHPETYSSGPLSRYSFLYTTFMAYVAKLNVFDVPLRLFLRFANVVLSMVGLLVSWRLIRELTESRLATVAALAIQTNVLMYAFISGAVNYDNLAFPLSFVALWAFLRHMKTRTIESAFVSVSAVLFGGLVKFTILGWLPFLCVGLVALHWRSRGRWRELAGSMLEFLKRPRGAVLSLLLLVGLFLNGNLYLVNLLYYDNVVLLECQPGLDLEMCKEENNPHRHFTRLAASNATKPRMDFDRYVPLFFANAVDRIFGVFAHREIRQPGDLYMGRASMLFYMSMVGLFFVLCRRTPRGPLIWALLGVTYYVGLVMLQHYRMYLQYGEFGMALQGRYWFPALPLMTALGAVGFLSIWPARARPYLVLVLFIAGTSFSFGHFQRQANPAIFLSLEFGRG